MQPEHSIRGAWGRTWPALLAVGTVGAVGGPAAVASYRHAHDVIALNGDPVMAPWLPLSVDGMLVAALVVIWVRRHRGDRAGAFPWLAFGFGMVVTILANLAAVAEPKPEAVAVAPFPPLALAITLELVALIAYRSRRDAEPYPAPVDDLDRTVTVVDGEDAPRDWWQDAPVVEARHEPAPEPVAVEHDQADDETDDETDDEGADPRVRDLARRLAAGEALTGAEVGQRYAVSARTGRRLIRQATEQGPTLALVSAGGES